MEHKYTDTKEINYERLESRVRKSNLLLQDNLLDEVINIFDHLNGPSLIVATGGSVVVANFLKMMLESMGSIAHVVEPRDINYMGNLNSYENMFLISYSGKTNGMEEAVSKFIGNKYLITGTSTELEKTKTISYETLMEDKERSFISLASTMIPITLLINAYKAMSNSYQKEEMDKRLENLFREAKEFEDGIKHSFKEDKILEVITGYDTNISSSALESNMVETGSIPVILHDKGAYCHGRSNMKFQNPKNPVIYLSHEDKELDKLLKELLKSEYGEILPIDSKSKELLFRDYEMLLKIYYLSKRIGEDKEIDVCQPDYNPNIVKKVYKYRGEM